MLQLPACWGPGLGPLNGKSVQHVLVLRFFHSHRSFNRISPLSQSESTKESMSGINLFTHTLLSGLDWEGINSSLLYIGLCVLCIDQFKVLTLVQPVWTCYILQVRHSITNIHLTRLAYFLHFLLTQLALYSHLNVALAADNRLRVANTATRVNYYVSVKSLSEICVRRNEYHKSSETGC